MAVKVSRDMFVSLLDKLKTMFPVSLQIHGTIQAINQCEIDESEIWVDSWPAIQAILVYPSGGNAAVPVLEGEHKLFAKNVESARQLLEYKKPLDGRNTEFTFVAVRQLLWPLIEETAGYSNFLTKFNTPVQLLYLPDVTPIPECPTVPDGYKLGSVRPSDADKVNKEWIFNTLLNTGVYVKRLIESFPSVAVYEQVSGDLVAWMIRYEDGAMGQLYVSPHHRRKGLGTICLISLARILRTQGQVPYVFVLTENSVSIKLHRKLGFVDSEENFDWVICNKYHGM